MRRARKPPVAALPPRNRAAALRLTSRAAVLPAKAQLPEDPGEALLVLTAAMAEEGASLVERVLHPQPGAAERAFRQWDHYPSGDAIDPVSGARWFYHAHPPEDRGEEEHGHFHLFLPPKPFVGIEPLAIPVKDDAAQVVHVAALTFDRDGLPCEWLATAHRVTMDRMMPGAAIAEQLDHLVLDQAGKDKHLHPVGRWLTLAAQANRAQLTELLRQRDEALANVPEGERAPEILSRLPFTID